MNPFLRPGLVLLMSLVSAMAADASPRIRPLTWAQPVIGTQLENLHQVSNEVYRSGQPKARDLKLLVEQLGVKSVLCLRDLHDDDDEAEGLPLALYRVEREADDVEPDTGARAMQSSRAASGRVFRIE